MFASASISASLEACPKLIAVIVSGFDCDGAAGLSGIKDVGGITIAQKLDTATQPDMPESAIASGCIDFVLSPEDIARELVRIAHARTTKLYGRTKKRLTQNKVEKIRF